MGEQIFGGKYGLRVLFQGEAFWLYVQQENHISP